MGARVALAVVCIAMAILALGAYFAAYLHCRQIVDRRMTQAATTLAADVKDVTILQLESGSRFPGNLPIHSVPLASGRPTFQVQVQAWHLDYGCVTAIVAVGEPVRVEKAHRPC